MNAAHACRNGLAWLWSRFHPSPPLSTVDLRRHLESGAIQKILLIRPQQGLGDLMLATPVFRALKDRHPAVSLHFIGNPRNAAAVQTHPCLSKLWILDKRALWNPIQCLGFFRALRREKYDLALVLIGNAPSLTSFLIAQFSGAPWVGSVQTDRMYGGNNWSRRLANWQAPAAKETDPEIRKFFALVAPLVDGPCPAPEFHIPEAVTAWAQTQWEKMGLTQEPAPVALFLGGNLKRAGRLWLPSAWAKLTRLLIEHEAGPVVAVCPPRVLSSAGVQETDFYEEFRRALGKDIPVFDQPGLPQAAAFLKPMALFICPDGGLFHTASAAGVRTLGLFFDTDPALWQPPLPTVTSLRAPEGRPEKLSPETVLETVLRIAPHPGLRR